MINQETNMETILFYVALVTILFFALLSLEIFRGHKSLRFLKDFPPLENSSSIPVSVIIPARNEEKNIEKALKSILNQDYKNQENIIVDDRSSDRTGEIIERMAKSDSRIRPFHIIELPKGWLGKNYAMYYGAQHAKGEYLLFTDADVVMEPATLSRAMCYMRENQLDHLTLGPKVNMQGILLNIFMGVFTIFLGLYSQPWKAKNPKSKKYVGLGVFNLVRSDVYRAIGTHQMIAMRPDDDMKLGKLVKNHRYRQDFLFAAEFISVEWYGSVRELIRGLEKNSYAGVEYSFLAIILATFFQFLFYVWPFSAVFFTHGMTQILNMMIITIILVIGMYTAGFHNMKKRYILGFPLGVLIFIYILWRSTIITLRNNGIDWRDTHYSLKELKANKV